MTIRWIAVFGLALFFNSSIVESIPVITSVSGICPQNKKTESAPGRYLEKVNPLAPTKENVEKGRKLFSEDANRPPANSVTGAGETATAVSQEGWSRLLGILLVET